MKQFLKSFSNAIRGFQYAFQSEKNFRIELACAIMVLCLGLVLRVDFREMIVLIFVSGWVLGAEIVNTVVERVVDMLKPRIHPYARLVKDLMASAVLVSAFVALLLGVMIFLPKLSSLLEEVLGAQS